MLNVLDDLKDFLKPISNQYSCGLPFRFNPVYTEIEFAREEDDPTLPMRQWERPLKTADWPWIEKRCTQVLKDQSKDLQIACWLLEAWIRQDSFKGLFKGLSLIHALLTQFWDEINPLLELSEKTGDIVDCAARVAPLEWMNHSISFTLRVHANLVSFEELKIKRLTLSEWKRLIESEITQDIQEKNQKPTPQLMMFQTLDKKFTKENLSLYAQEHLRGEIKVKQKEIFMSKEVLERISTFLDKKLSADSPSFNHLKSTLVDIERTLYQIINEDSNLKDINNKTLEIPVEMIDVELTSSLPEPPQISTRALTEAEQAIQLALKSHNWGSRENSYQSLESLANYLSKVEPHSLTPYLIRKAVHWGRMPLLDLLVEIMNEEGDLNRLIQILGITKIQKPKI